MVKIFFTSFLFLISMISGFCQKSEIKKSPIIGIWIEKINKSDSLIFLPEYDGQNPIFQLKRGFDQNDRTRLPKPLSGPYWYKLDTNRISISWFLSSDARYHSYYFWLSSDKTRIRIGNFFGDNKSQKDTLTFIKVK
jgi:hypothetical protein